MVSISPILSLGIGIGIGIGIGFVDVSTGIGNAFYLIIFLSAPFLLFELLPILRTGLQPLIVGKFCVGNDT